MIVSLHDIKPDLKQGSVYVETKHTTNTISNNGFCPIWNETQYYEFLIYNPSIAMILFSLCESDVTFDDQVSYAAIPINLLKTGYRSIQLYDANNRRSGLFDFASLLVEIDLIPIGVESSSK